MELKSFDFSKKVALHPFQYFNIKNNKRPFPITIEVDLTNNCNHRCSFCVWGEHISTDKSSLKTETIKTCLKEMRELGSKAITLVPNDKYILLLTPRFAPISKHRSFLPINFR